MHYTWYELAFFFFVYSLLGWALEIVVRALRTGKLCDPSPLSGPWCPSYGLGALVVILALEPLGGSNIPAQLIGCLVLANLVEYFSSVFVGVLAGQKLEAFRRSRLIYGSRNGLFYTLAWGILAMLALYFLQPFVYLGCQLLPNWLIKGLVIAGLLLLGFDVLAMAFVLQFTRRHHRITHEVSERLEKTSLAWGSRVFHALQDHLYRAFPELEDTTPAPGEGFGKPKEERVFAQGLCLPKLIWVFIISCLLGDWIETVYVWATSGVLMSRSSLLYGTFSVVWGLGAVLLTALLSPLSGKPDRYIFLGGALLGGFYEYMCSVFTELVFGTVFWDYSNMPLNIGGRTNVLYMIFWGILSVVWINLLYPRLSGWIERIPPVAGTIATWVVTVLFCADILISAGAMLRYTDRRQGTATPSAYGQFMDRMYPDELVEWTWPNMQYTQGEDAGVPLGEKQS